MAAVAESVRIAPEAEVVAITAEALEESERRCSAARPKLWSDVMSELSDSTDAPDHHSLDKEFEANGVHSGGESAASFDDGLKLSKRRAPEETRLKLSSAGFAPLCAELKFVIGQLHMFLYHCPVLAQVHLQEGRLGSPTKLTAELSDASLNSASVREQWILEPARQALSMSVQNSQGVYMIGYGGEAFENFYGEGFKATLGIPNEADNLCWDTWQWGYCSRPASCRCRHPHKHELMEVSVFLCKPKHR